MTFYDEIAFVQIVTQSLPPGWRPVSTLFRANCPTASYAGMTAGGSYSPARPGNSSSLSVERSATVVVIVIGSFLWFKKDAYDYDHDNEIGFLTGFLFAP